MSAETYYFLLSLTKILGGLLNTLINWVMLASIKSTTFVLSTIGINMTYLDVASTKVTKYASFRRCPWKLIGPATSELIASPGSYDYCFRWCGAVFIFSFLHGPQSMETCTDFGIFVLSYCNCGFIRLSIIFWGEEWFNIR